MPRTAPGANLMLLRLSSSLAGIGDGVVATALPLLAASVTRDPLAVASVVAAQHVPWVLAALVAPSLIRRLDGRTVVGGVDTLRAVLMIVVGLGSARGGPALLTIQLAAVVVGLGEAFTDLVADATDGTSGRQRAIASGRPRLSTGGLVGLALVGMPVGGILYEILPVVPFLADVLAFALAALLALLVARPLRSQASAGAVRLLAPPRRVPGTARIIGVAAAAGAASSAVLGVLVLFALDDLGLGAPAFGVLLAGLAVSAAVGSVAGPEVARSLGPRRGLTATLLATGVAYGLAVLLADDRFPVLGMAALAVAAAAAMAAGALVRGVLLSVAGPSHERAALRALHLAAWTAIPVGALAGGVIGQAVSVAGTVVAAGVVAALTGLAVLVLGVGEGTAPPRPRPRPRPPVRRATPPATTSMRPRRPVGEIRLTGGGQRGPMQRASGR